MKIGIRNLTNFDLSSQVSKILTLMRCVWAKYKFFEIKKYRGVIFHETEEEYKIWRGIDLSFQNWYKEFDKFWSEHSKVSKIFPLMGFFWAKYILFKLKKYRGVIFQETEEGYKIWRGINLSFQYWHKEFYKFWHEHSKVSKIFTLMGSFWAKYILLELKKVERSYLSWHRRMMQSLKKNWLVAWKMTWIFFDQSTRKCQNWNFDGILLPKLENVWP